MSFTFPPYDHFWPERPRKDVQEKPKATRVVTTSEAIVITVDLPGRSECDVTVTVANHEMTISALAVGHRPQHHERVALADDTLDTAAIEAELSHGVLTVIVPRKPEAKPRQVSILRTGTTEKAKRLLGS